MKTMPVTVSTKAFVSIAIHSVCHRDEAVHGILVGKQSGDVVRVDEAFPLCHETPSRPLLDIAFALVEAQINGYDDGTFIVGWFTAPENLTDNRSGPVALRVVATLASEEFEPVLLVVRNEELGDFISGTKGHASNAIKAYGKDFGGNWMEPLMVSVEEESEAAMAVRDAYRNGNKVSDLIDHWESKGTLALPW